MPRGLIVGPEDPSGRFEYSVARLARAGGLALGQPDDRVQWVDVRDLAAWLVFAAETGLTGTTMGLVRRCHAGNSWPGSRRVWE